HQQGADRTIGREPVLAFAAVRHALVADDLACLCLQLALAHLCPALGFQRTVAPGLLRARALRLEFDLVRSGCGPGMPRQMLLARHLRHLGLLDQSGLEKLFLEWIALGHGDSLWRWPSMIAAGACDAA